jgi:hypothetical protein
MTRRLIATVGLTLGATLSLSAAPALASVLDVGDSLAVGSEPTLKQIVPSLTVDAEVGRTSSTGVGILSREYAGQDVVIFDLGTNDDPSQPEALLADLRQARQIIGNACLIIATINRPPYNGTSYAAINRAIEGFSLADGNTQVIPWQLATKLHPEVVGPDGVHVTAYGYEFRAHLFATAVSECPGGGATTGPPGGVAPPASPAPAPAPPKPKPKPKPFHFAAVVGSAGVFAAGLIERALTTIVAAVERLP